MANTLGSNNPFPSVLLVEGDPEALAANPAAGQRRLAVGTDHLLYLVDDAGVATEVGTSVSDILDIPTAETDDTLVLAPDGAGGVEFRAEAGGSGLTDPMTTRGDIIYRNASNVSDRLAVGSSGQKVLGSDGTDVSWVYMANEGAAAQLVNATATGDSGGRSFHFTGNAVPGAFSSEATALGSSTVKYSVWAQVLGGGANHQLQAFTPSGAFRIESRVWVRSTTNQNGAGILVRDSGTGDASGNGALAQYVNNTSGGVSIRILTLDTGTYTARQTSVVVTGSTTTPFLPFIYLAIIRDGSNNWSAAASFDRVMWTTTATTSKTFTVAKMGTRISNADAGWDFIDVVS